MEKRIETNLELLANSLPEQFPFYHLGEVRLAETEADSQATELDEDRLAIGFTLNGDLQAALVILLDQGLDPSMYSELGNIVASRWVTRLSEEKGLDLVLSPPRTLRASQLRLLRDGARQVVRKTYFHSYRAQGEFLIPIQLRLYLSEGVSNV